MVGDFAAATKLEPREALAADRDQDQSVVVEADRFAIAAKRELRDRVEANEERRQEREEPGLGFEREAVPALAVHSEPPVADQRTLFPVAGAEEMENTGQTLVGKIGSVVSSVSDFLVKVGFFVGLNRRGGKNRHRFEAEPAAG